MISGGAKGVGGFTIMDARDRRSCSTDRTRRVPGETIETTVLASSSGSGGSGGDVGRFSIGVGSALFCRVRGTAGKDTGLATGVGVSG